ncbi:MAG: hypothetical protein ABR924_06875 [Terracidiphilus sp.]
MQITVTVFDAIVREAGAYHISVLEFVESLIDKGMSPTKERPGLNDAIERIRALRSPEQGPGH